MESRPNILVIMSDEHAPMYSHAYGHPRIETPHMDALAAGGTLFQDAYCPSPLCVPSRAAFVSGKHVHRIGAYDNGAPFPSETVTFPHLLRGAGYEVVLDGKMHFVGPDTLHGFGAQLTRDAHRDPDSPTITGREWSDPHPAGGARARERIESAGPGRAAHLDFDDEVEAAALELDSRPGRRRRAPGWPLVPGGRLPGPPLPPDRPPALLRPLLPGQRRSAGFPARSPGRPAPRPRARAAHLQPLRLHRGADPGGAGRLLRPGDVHGRQDRAPGGRPAGDGAAGAYPGRLHLGPRRAGRRPRAVVEELLLRASQPRAPDPLLAGGAPAGPRRGSLRRGRLPPGPDSHPDRRGRGARSRRA